MCNLSSQIKVGWVLPLGLILFFFFFSLGVILAGRWSQLRQFKALPSVWSGNVDVSLTWLCGAVYLKQPYLQFKILLKKLKDIKHFHFKKFFETGMCLPLSYKYRYIYMVVWSGNIINMSTFGTVIFLHICIFLLYFAFGEISKIERKSDVMIFYNKKNKSMNIKIFNL